VEEDSAGPKTGGGGSLIKGTGEERGRTLRSSNTTLEESDFVRKMPVGCEGKEQVKNVDREAGRREKKGSFARVNGGGG